VKRGFLVPAFLGFCAILAVVMGTLFRLRLLPFLRPDTILSGGKHASTEQFAHLISDLFYVAGAATIALAVATLISLLRARRRFGPFARMK
jgi:hypothetical protein